MMDYFVNFVPSVLYVISGPYFLISIGATTGLAMFVGSIIFDGNLTTAYKGIFALLVYMFVLFQVNFSRISVNYSNTTGLMSVGQAYASITTIILISIPFVIGIFLGVFVSSKYIRESERR